MGREGNPGHSRLLHGWWGVGSCLGPSWEKATRRMATACAKCQPRGAAAPPIPENQRHPSRGEKGGGLIINSAGGKVRPPAHSRAPSPIIMPARLLSPRAHAESLLLYFGLFSVSSVFYARGRVLRVKASSPSSSPCFSPFRKTPEAIICLRISFETATRKTNDCSFPSVSDPSHPFIWLSLELRPRLFCGGDLREPRQFPSRCDVAKD